MILHIFAVRDRATDQFGTPMFLVNKGHAIRSFSDEINRSAVDNQLFNHADDFDLYALGLYDTDKGMFTCDRGPEQIAVGKDLQIKN